MGVRARCRFPGCSGFASSGSDYCAVHATEGRRDRAVGRRSTAARLAAEERDRQQAAAVEFERRLEAGEYRTLLGVGLGSALEEAARESGVGHELGALRVTLARVLADRSMDPGRQAQAVARLCAASVQAQRIQRAISGQVAESLTDAMTQILAELGGDE